MMFMGYLVLTNSEISLLETSVEFSLNGFLNVVSGKLLVFLEDFSKMSVASGDQDCVERRLVGAPLSLSCGVETLRVGSYISRIHISAFVSVGLESR